MRLLTLLFCTFLCTSARAQMTPIEIQTAPAPSSAFTGDLALGAPLERFDWAWDSQNACFVETRQEHFTGNMVLYRTEIPRYSTMVIRLIPDDPTQEMSLLAYSGGGGALPPELRSCVSCEADFPLEQRRIGRDLPAHVREIELRAVTRPYPITIAVFGADGLAEGGYRLEVEVRKNR